MHTQTDKQDHHSNAAEQSRALAAERWVITSDHAYMHSHPYTPNVPKGKHLNAKVNVPPLPYIN